MQNVGFRATPALIERYNELIRQNPSLGEVMPERVALFGCATVSVVEFQVLFLKIQPTIAVDRYGNVDKLIAISIADSLELSVGTSMSISTAKCNEDLTGVSFSKSKTIGTSKGLSFSHSVSYSTTGISYSVSMNYGITVYQGSGLALTYTFML